MYRQSTVLLRISVLMAVLLPAVSTAYATSPLGSVEGLNTSRSSVPADSGHTCEFSPQEIVMRDLLVQHPDQMRSTLECDPELMEFAEQRANDMAERDYFSHVTPEGHGPHDQLRESGYDLPRYYVGGRANAIESILGGEADPHQAWKLLLDSVSHRRHLLGEDDMFRAQRRFGVAHVRHDKSAHRDYWVIVIIEPKDPDEPKMTCTPPPSICIRH